MGRRRCADSSPRLQNKGNQKIHRARENPEKSFYVSKRGGGWETRRKKNAGENFADLGSARETKEKAGNNFVKSCEIVEIYHVFPAYLTGHQVFGRNHLRGLTWGSNRDGVRGTAKSARRCLSGSASAVGYVDGSPNIAEGDGIGE
eukprot:347556-Amorphochlora_amoeboformis.AAC.1